MQDSKAVSSEKGADDYGRLNKQLYQLRTEVRELKQKINNMNNNAKKKNQILQIPINLIDYEKTPRMSLHDLLKGIKVVFLGLNENYESFRRLENISGLHVIAGNKNNYDASVIKNADFLFIYKNSIAHSVIWHACSGKTPPPCCFLLEHTNKELLENGLANVLYRYAYKR